MAAKDPPPITAQPRDRAPRDPDEAQVEEATDLGGIPLDEIFRRDSQRRRR